MPNDAYEAWWAYFVARAKHAAVEKAQTEHDDVMGKVARAAR